MMFHDLTKDQKRAFRDAAALAHRHDRTMTREDRDVYYLEARNAELPLVVGGAVANGTIRIEDVGEPARALAADVAERLRALASEPTAEADIGEGPYDPTALVSISSILDEVDLLHDDETLYVNRNTGAIQIVQDHFIEVEEDPPADDEAGDETDAAEEDDQPDRDGPDWIVAAKARCRELAADPDWVATIRGRDIDDREAMRRFARNAGPAASRDLHEALQGRGAARRFRRVIAKRRMEAEWESYRLERLAETIQWHLEQVRVPFRR